ncbi:MAG: ATP-binding cassette domain-containing protein [Steroidobacteraceae bacterium]
MPLITLRDACLAFGDRPLLDCAALTVRDDERLGFIGRNGTGKSTVLKIIAGLTVLDEGELQRRSGLRLALLEQEPQLPSAPTLRESLIERARTLAHASSCTPEQLHGTDRESWQLHSRLAEYLQRLALTGEERPQDCSGGERKRAALALALACEPELLLLDEPTNHLDIDGIALLEEHVRRMPAAIIVTHDRAFLDAVATRIVELDRGIIRSYPGNFATYEARREQEVAAEDATRRRFEKFWRQEEVWIRKGVEARRTRNEGRVRRLEQLRQQRTERRERIGRLKLTLDAGERSGHLVAELIGVGQTFSTRTLIEDFSTRILRGDRVGFIGPNGAGKSTLLRIILGTYTPERGSVRLGTNLQIAYFDQMREQLDPRATVAEAISPGTDWITVGGERKHVVTYLADFLFPPHRARSPIEMLSGGERNRLLLARLFARPANLLVLDEPTNDLDIDSLELLEQHLQDYPGTLLLVSHDRRFLDNIVTQTIAAEGGGRWRTYVGGYSDWLRQRPPPRPQTPAAARADLQAVPAKRTPKSARLGYMTERELAALPAQIEALEHEQMEIGARMSQPQYRAQGPERARSDAQRLEDIEAQLQRLYERWEVLEARAGGGANDTPEGR